MPLEVIQGEIRNRAAARDLAAQLRGIVQDGTLYLGYPVLSTVDDRVQVDALLVSSDHGLAAFMLADGVPDSDADWARVIDEQDRLYTLLESHLNRHEGLRSGRRLAVPLNTMTVFPVAVEAPEDEDRFFGSVDQAPAWVAGLAPIDSAIERRLQAALQRVTTIKPPKKRSSVEDPSSRGAKVKEMERAIANLDRWQNMAAIGSPEGPQRIRGLAGSGKTVVLALKAAYWHTQEPDWVIALTFHTRALYQQFENLATRFAFEHSSDAPDREHLRIIHAWGSRSQPGVYSTIALALGETPRDWAYAQGKYGRDEAFQGVCRELLELAQGQEVAPIFDAVLIDEAQDLPPEFFQLVYRFTKEPKRIVWGYDELQRLSESAMPTTDELFGTGPDGESLVNLESPPDAPPRDIVLPICYRNSPWALATAHALGIGVYRSEGVLQHPDEPDIWQDIGYNVVHGELEEGSRVTLERSRESYPPYFSDLLTPADAVVFESFPDEPAQDRWVAAQIATNLSADELEHDDILIVLPDAYRAKSRAPSLMRALRRHDIDSHLVGVNTSVDEVFLPGSIAIAQIYRAKGNEAPMVYAVDSQYAVSDYNAVTRRNTLFTAITRSRAWVRITGWGERVTTIGEEMSAVFDKGFKLDFTIPTAARLAELRHIHRDRRADEVAIARKATQGLTTFVEALDRGDVDIYDLPPELRTKLIMSLRRDGPDDDG